ncbi:hypothetical protein LVJ94_10550 [Pendulispora rubella]|uniref:Uncharacterized protein n=1 Tax=Pendulispora rubella TaxID=2741070 RepID=A0ABZ2LA75_9BACT
MDTTAKVDIRKLQLLNDRIAQTIEALNQVRLSVHGLGLSHTTGNVPGLGLGNVGGNVGLGFQGGVPFGLQGAVPWGQNIGIQHTSPFGYQQGLQGLQALQGLQGIPGYQQGLQGMIPGLGLQHSNPFLGLQQGIPGMIPGLGLQQGIPGMIPGLQHASPFGYQQGIPGVIPGLGLQHTSPYGFGYQQQAGGWPVQGLQGLQGQNNVWGVPNVFGGGLAHTSPDVLELQNRQLGLGQLGLGQVGLGQVGYGLDPFTHARILQNFPFAQSAVPGLF